MKKHLVLSYSMLSLLLALGIAGCNGADIKESSSTVPSDSSSQSQSQSQSQQESTSKESSSSESSSVEESSPEESSSSVEVSDPVITLSSEAKIIVAAGQEVALPTFTATDYDGTDLTSFVEVEDSFDSQTISTDKTKFSSKIAGKHMISYYVESETERFCEKTVEVEVTPATAENFDVEGYKDPTAIKTYGVFKENFEDGKKNNLSLADANDSSYISGTEEAISGNSLIVDANATGGSAANQLFMNAFNESFIKGLQVNYTLEFDYKVLTNNGNMNDFYASLFYDGFDGYNVNGFNQDGAVHHFKWTWTQVNLPEGKNAWFSVWKLSPHASDAKIAIDNIVVSAEECVQATSYIPTAAQLEAGVQWDMADKAMASTNGELMLVSKVANDTVKTALQGNNTFGDNVLHLTGADDHKVTAFTSDNLTAGKQFHCEITYYSVNNGGLCYIMMGAGNPTLKNDSEVVVTDLGNGFYKATIDYVLKTGQYEFNIYGHNNPNFDIYVGEIKAQLLEYQPPVVDPVGTKTLDNAEFYGMDGGETAAHTYNKTTSTATVDVADGDATLWISIGAGSFLKENKNYIYKFSIEYTNFTADKLCVRYDSREFDDFTSSFANYTGKVDYELTKEMTADGSFFGIYMLHATGSYKISDFVVVEDTSVKVKSGSFYGMDGGETAAHTYDKTTSTATVDVADGDATLWISISAGSFLKENKNYIYKFSIEYTNFTADKLCLRYDSREFDDFTSSFTNYTGKVDYELTKEMTADGGFFGIYMLNATGSYKISNFVVVEDTSVKVKSGSFYGMDGGETAAHTYDKTTSTATVNATDGDATLWLSISAGSFLKADKNYTYKFTIEYTNFTADKLCLRYDSSAFDEFEGKLENFTGKKEYVVTKEMEDDGAFFGIYMLHAAGSCKISDFVVIED